MRIPVEKIPPRDLNSRSALPVGSAGQERRTRIHQKFWVAFVTLQILDFFNIAKSFQSSKTLATQDRQDGPRQPPLGLQCDLPGH